MKFLFRYLFLVLGCLHLVGGPHSLIQLYAWGNMLVEYSRDSTLAQAAEDTFSGKKPCSLCNKIAAVKSAEPEDNEGPLSPLTGKSFQDLFPPSVATIPSPPLSPRRLSPPLRTSFPRHVAARRLHHPGVESSVSVAVASRRRQ